MNIDKEENKTVTIDDVTYFIQHPAGNRVDRRKFLKAKRVKAAEERRLARIKTMREANKQLQKEKLLKKQLKKEKRLCV